MYTLVSYEANTLPAGLNYDHIVPIYRKSKVQLLVNARVQLLPAFLLRSFLRVDDLEFQVYQPLAILNIYNPYDQRIMTLL